MSHSSAKPRPKTLFDWRKEPFGKYGTARHLWDCLEEPFERRGYRLFINGPGKLKVCYGPRAESERRAPDGYHHLIDPSQPVDRRIRYLNHTNKCCPATRLSDGAHVMIHLMVMGNEGKTEQKILRYFSQPDLASLPHNHVIPLLDEIEHEDMCFAVTPLLHDGGLTVPWFQNLAEALEAVSQSLECFAFLHANLVAHLDVGFSDFLSNYGGTLDCAELKKAEADPHSNPFRSLFPCKYYLIDFELSVMFSSSSDPASRVIKGIPFAESRRSTDLAKYGKAYPPEWEAVETSYCPFKSDVFQLGSIWLKCLKHALPILPKLAELLEQMMETNPETRLSAEEAYGVMSQLKRDVPEEVLVSAFPES